MVVCCHDGSVLLWYILLVCCGDRMVVCWCRVLHVVMMGWCGDGGDGGQMVWCGAGGDVCCGNGGDGGVLW